MHALKAHAQYIKKCVRVFRVYVLFLFLFYFLSRIYALDKNKGADMQFASECTKEGKMKVGYAKD